MKKGNRSLNQIRVVYVVTTFFLVTLSIYTFTQIKSLIDSSNLVNNTTLITQSLHKISSAVFEAETNKRGYLLTGEKSMLNKKEAALSYLLFEQHSLETLLKNNQLQSNNLKVLNYFIQLKVNSLNSITPPITSIGINSSIKNNTLEGTASKDSVMRHIDKMYGIETGLLQLRRDKYAQLSFATPLYIIVLFLGALAILWASYIKINIELFNSQNLSKQLLIQYRERDLKASKLTIANKELEFQNLEREQKAAELIIANKELAFQNREKERKAAELIIANKELEFQNKEKEQRAAELIIANKELAFQNKEKENRAKELVIANRELLSENEIKEQRATELTHVNEELRVFNQIASHDLQEPLRKIQMFASRIVDDEYGNLSEKGKIHFEIIDNAATRMRTLIEDLITYSQTNNEERELEVTDLYDIVEVVKADLEDTIIGMLATIDTNNLGNAKVIPFQFRQLFNNLISNALKFSIVGIPSHIIIKSETKKGKELDEITLLLEKEYCHISITDNGIGFESAYNEKVFQVFQRLHGKEKYKGTGIGLAIVKKIVENHGGVIKASGIPDKGARFDIYLPS